MISVLICSFFISEEPTFVYWMRSKLWRKSSCKIPEAVRLGKARAALMWRSRFCERRETEAEFMANHFDGAITSMLKAVIGGRRRQRRRLGVYDDRAQSKSSVSGSFSRQTTKVHPVLTAWRRGQPGQASATSY